MEKFKFDSETLSSIIWLLCFISLPFMFMMMDQFNHRNKMEAYQMVLKCRMKSLPDKIKLCGELPKFDY